MYANDPFGWVGSVIDSQFSVHRVAGEGSFGVVYQGTHLGLETPVAIKCLKAPDPLNELERQQVLAAIRTEARLLHQLSRRTASIVQALDVGAAVTPHGRWSPYIVMEWLEGETLEDNLRHRQAACQHPYRLDEAIALLTPAAMALAIAHEESVSHRDVKPGNLFLTASRRGPFIKVVDFGIAKVFDQTKTIAADARTDGERKFTARYAAPEQFDPTYGPTGPWTDVFAMALILIEVASGQFALKGDTLLQILSACIDPHRRPNLHACGVNVAPRVDEVLSRALSVSPAARFRNMSELWSALDAVHGKPDHLAEAFGHTLSAASLELTPHPSSTMSPASLVDARSTGENRVCTVVFMGLSAATMLTARLDPEAVQDVIDRSFKAVREQVEALGGIVEVLGSDRAMAVFGLPRATDSDAEKAVLAALRIQATLARMPMPRAARSCRPSVQIGVDTGRIFTGTATGGRRSLSLVGEAVNIAAQLQQSAPSGAIVVGSSTYRQVANLFNVEPLVHGDITTYKILGPIAFRAEIAPTDFYGLQTKFVNRVPEIHRLLDALDTMLIERKPQLVTLVGAAGIGRSRMLAEFFSRVKSRKETFMVLTARGSLLSQDISYDLTTKLIRARFEIQDTDATTVVRSKLRRGLRWFRMHTSRAAVNQSQIYDLPEPDDIDDALGQLATLVGQSPARTSPATSVTFNNDNHSAQHRIHAAIARLLDFVGTRMPIVLLCDDLHWADSASLDLLDDLASTAVDRPLLIVGSARPEFQDRKPSWAERHQIVQLDPLADRHIEEIIRDRLRNTPDLSPELVKLLAERAEGNPLTLTETLHFLVDTGVLSPHQTQSWSVQTSRLRELSLPPTVQGILQARLDQLDPEARDVLGRAAVVGRTFWQDAVDCLRQVGTRGHFRSSTADILAQLRARQLIRLREPSSIPGEREYVFAESAMQEVSYETLTLRVKRSLHLVAARWLAEHLQNNAASALLALHYDRGDDPARAAMAYARAGNYAASLGDQSEAMRHLGRARDIHDESCGQDPADNAEDRRVASWRERARVRMDLGDVLRRLCKLDEAEAMYEQARAQVLRKERRLGAVYDPAEAVRWDARLDFRTALVYKVRGDMSSALHLVEQALARANEGRALEDTPAMYALLAFVHRRQRRPDAAMQAATKGLRICRSLQQRGERWRDDVVQLLAALGVSQYARGRLVSAERLYRQAARLASETESPHLAGLALNGVAGIRNCRGDLRGTREMLLRSLRFKERAGDPHQIAVAHSNLAEVCLRLNDATSALKHAHLAVRLGEQASAGSDLADMYRNLAEVSLAKGELDGALKAATKALQIAEVQGRVYLPETAETLARVCAAVHQVSPDKSRLHDHAVQTANLLLTMLATSLTEGDLVARADACRALIAPLVATAARTAA